LDEIFFELATKDIRDPALAEQPVVERCVQPVRDQVRAGVQRAYAIDDRQRQPRRGVHRQEESDDRGVAHGRLRQTFLCEIGADHVDASLLQPRDGRREPERLAPHVVRRDEQHLHSSIVSGARARWPSKT
jgi:hypothetical protein